MIVFCPLLLLALVLVAAPPALHRIEAWYFNDDAGDLA